jgi:hypothetical protein
MKKTWFLLVVFLYIFMVVLRLVGQFVNNMWDASRVGDIDWKSTLTLGELDGTQDYGTRWKWRIITMLVFPFLWLSFIEKWVKKI